VPLLTSHVSELFAASLEVVAVLGLNGILNGTGHGVVDAQDGTLDQLHLTGGITAQVTTTARSPSRSLSLAPGLGGRGLASSVGGGHPARHAKRSRGAFRLARVNRACRIGIMITGGGVRGVRLGQTVSRGRANGRDPTGVRVVKGRRKGTLLVGQESPRGIFIFPILSSGLVLWFDFSLSLSQSKRAKGVGGGEKPLHMEGIDRWGGAYLSTGRILMTLVVGRVRARPLVGHDGRATGLTGEIKRRLSSKSEEGSLRKRKSWSMNAGGAERLSHRGCRS
jgi:hypothetical protein